MRQGKPPPSPCVCSFKSPLATAACDDCKYPSLFPRILSGSIGAVVTALAVTPLEVVKIRQQLAPSPTVRPCPSCGTFVLNNGLMECVVSRKLIPYANVPPKIAKMAGATGGGTGAAGAGTFSVLRHIFATEGVAGIYAGLAPTLVMSVPNTVMYFTAYDEIRARLSLQPRADEYGPWIPLVAGSSARLLASLTTAPLELLRTRQAMSGSAGLGTGMWAKMREILRLEGVGSLFKGLGPTLWRDVPFSAIYWFSIEQFKIQWREKATEHPTLLQQGGEALINGATAGMIAAACTTPFDVVKTRRQTMTAPIIAEEVVLDHCRHDGATPAYRRLQPQTTFGVMRQILHDEGLPGLWRGNTTRMIKVAPACAIMITCYELGKVLLE